MRIAIGPKHADKPIRSRSEKHADRISSDEKIYLIIQIRPAQKKTGSDDASFFKHRNMKIIVRKNGYLIQ